MSNAWSYLVVSSDAQAETIDTQRTWAAGVAKRNGWSITREFSGVASGKAGTRKILEDLIDELELTPKRDRPERVLLIHLDRVGRMALDAIGSLAKLRRLKVSLHTRELGDVRLETAMDSMRSMFEMVAAELSNERRSSDWKAAHARRRAAGLHVGSIPFGVVLIDGRAVPYEPEAAIVRELFALAAKGWGYTRLARWARERVTKKRRSDGTDKPYSFGQSTIQQHLRAKTLRGLVVPEDLWDAAQRSGKAEFRERVSPRYPWPLTGAVRCTCGKMLEGRTSGKAPKRVRYYVCRHHSLEPGQKTTPSHRADALEAAFAAFLARSAAEPGVGLRRESTHAASALKRRESDLEKALADVDARRRRVWELAEKAKLSDDLVRERFDELEADRSNLRAQLDDVRRQLADVAVAAPQIEALVDVYAELARGWPSAPPDRQRETAKAVAALPSVRGLWADPARRNELLTGADAAILHVTTASRSIAAFPGKRLLALIKASIPVPVPS